MYTLPSLETLQSMHIALKPPMVQVKFWPPISSREYRTLMSKKLRSYHIKHIKEIFGHAIHKEQKQKIRALDFGVNSKSESILNNDISVIREKACFKCGSESHFIKDRPLNKQDTKVLQGKYTNQKTNTNTNSAPDKVM